MKKQTKELLEILDKNRLLILASIYDCDICKKDICGIDLVSGLGISKNLLSYHLKILRESGFLLEEKIGQRKIYKINKEKLEKTKQILETFEFI